MIIPPSCCHIASLTRLNSAIKRIHKNGVSDQQADARLVSVMQEKGHLLLLDLEKSYSTTTELVCGQVETGSGCAAFVLRGDGILVGCPGKLIRYDLRKKPFTSTDIHLKLEDDDAGSEVLDIARQPDADKFAVAAGRKVFVIDIDGNLLVEVPLSLPATNLHWLTTPNTTAPTLVAVSGPIIYTWTEGACECGPTLEGHATSYNTLCVAEKTMRVAAAAADQDRVSCWDLKGKLGTEGALPPSLCLKGFEGRVTCMEWNEEGRYLATVDGSECTVWDVPQLSGEVDVSNAIVCCGHDADTNITCLTFQPGGSLLATGSDASCLLLFDTRGFRSGGVVAPLTKLQLDAGAITALQWLSTTELMVGTADGQLTCFQVSLPPPTTSTTSTTPTSAQLHNPHFKAQVEPQQQQQQPMKAPWAQSPRAVTAAAARNSGGASGGAAGRRLQSGSTQGPPPPLQQYEHPPNFQNATRGNNRELDHAFAAMELSMSSGSGGGGGGSGNSNSTNVVNAATPKSPTSPPPPPPPPPPPARPPLRLRVSSDAASIGGGDAEHSGSSRQHQQQQQHNNAYNSNQSQQAQYHQFFSPHRYSSGDMDSGGGSSSQNSGGGGGRSKGGHQQHQRGGGGGAGRTGSGSSSNTGGDGGRGEQANTSGGSGGTGGQGGSLSPALLQHIQHIREHPNVPRGHGHDPHSEQLTGWGLGSPGAATTIPWMSTMHPSAGGIQTLPPTMMGSMMHHPPQIGNPNIGSGGSVSAATMTMPGQGGGPGGGTTIQYAPTMQYATIQYPGGAMVQAITPRGVTYVPASAMNMTMAPMQFPATAMHPGAAGGTTTTWVPQPGGFMYATTTTTPSGGASGQGAPTPYGIPTAHHPHAHHLSPTGLEPAMYVTNAGGAIMHPHHPAMMQQQPHHGGGSSVGGSSGASGPPSPATRAAFIRNNQLVVGVPPPPSPRTTSGGSRGNNNSGGGRMYSGGGGSRDKGGGDTSSDVDATEATLRNNSQGSTGSTTISPRRHSSNSSNANINNNGGGGSGHQQGSSRRHGSGGGSIDSTQASQQQQQRRSSEIGPHSYPPSPSAATARGNTSKSPPPAAAARTSATGGCGGGGTTSSTDASSVDTADRTLDTVYIGNLPTQVDESTLGYTCMHFGPVTHVQVIRDKATQVSRGFAFVTFAHPAYAVLAMQQLNGQVLYGPFQGMKIKVAPTNQRAKAADDNADDTPSE